MLISNSYDFEAREDEFRAKVQEVKEALKMEFDHLQTLMLIPNRYDISPIFFIFTDKIYFLSFRGPSFCSSLEKFSLSSLFPVS